MTNLSFPTRFLSVKYYVVVIVLFLALQAKAQNIFNTDQLNRCNTAVNYKLFTAAQCWALESGAKGIIGHDRLKCAYGYWAECCDYGSNRAIDIVLSLLIDEGVPDLGHRKIILYGAYQDVGISIQPHAKYRNCTVIDFK